MHSLEHCSGVSTANYLNKPSVCSCPPPPPSRAVPIFQIFVSEPQRFNMGRTWDSKVWEKWFGAVFMRERSSCKPADEDLGGCGWPRDDPTPLGMSSRDDHPRNSQVASLVLWSLLGPGPACWWWALYRRGEPDLLGLWGWECLPWRVE